MSDVCDADVGDSEEQRLTSLLHRHELHPDFAYIDMGEHTLNDDFFLWLRDRGFEVNMESVRAESGVRWRLSNDITDVDQLREVAERHRLIATDSEQALRNVYSSRLDEDKRPTWGRGQAVEEANRQLDAFVKAEGADAVLDKADELWHDRQDNDPSLAIIARLKNQAALENVASNMPEGRHITRKKDGIAPDMEL